MLSSSASIAQPTLHTSGNAPAAKSTQHADAPETLPEVNLDFAQEKLLPGITASPVIAMPIHCGPDGSALLQMLMPPDFKRTALYLVSKSRAIPISLSAVTGISKPQVLDVFDSESRLGLLLYGLPKSNDGDLPSTPGFFVAEFKHDGMFQKLVNLPRPGIYSRFALLPSDDLVTLEFDPINAVAKLILRDSDGEEERALQIPGALEDVASGANRPATLKQRPSFLRSDMETLSGSAAVGKARFTSFGDRVLLWIPNVQSVTELGDHAAFRQIQIDAPKGYAFDSLISSTDRWIARFKRMGLSGTTPIDMRPQSQNFVLYEVNPFDGHLHERLNLGPHGSWLACESDGTLTVFKTDKKQHLIALTADIGR
ncbi:MAG TPA: hypothetical protein VFI20_10085 [Terracidiphilus sp.]|nr:hypothetical protein [Terracidiphilus sp.]